MSENTTLLKKFDILTVVNKNRKYEKLERRCEKVKQYSHYILILACLIAIFFLYNKQLASIPLLLMSIVLFYVAYKKAINLKNKK